MTMFYVVFTPTQQIVFASARKSQCVQYREKIGGRDTHFEIMTDEEFIRRVKNER